MKEKPKCGVCNRDPKKMNSEWAECSHGKCPHRKNPWADMTPSTKEWEIPIRETASKHFGNIEDEQ